MVAFIPTCNRERETALQTSTSSGGSSIGVGGTSGTGDGVGDATIVGTGVGWAVVVGKAVIVGAGDSVGEGEVEEAGTTVGVEGCEGKVGRRDSGGRTPVGRIQIHKKINKRRIATVNLKRS